MNRRENKNDATILFSIGMLIGGPELENFRRSFVPEQNYPEKNANFPEL